MLTGNKNTLQTHPNLLPLRAALTAAERATPARPIRPVHLPRVDVNEQRARQLIAQLQAQYKREKLFPHLRNIPNSRGLHVNLPVTTNIHVG